MLNKSKNSAWNLWILMKPYLKLYNIASNLIHQKNEQYIYIFLI